VDSVDVTTEIYLPPGEVYDFLLEFQNYAEYSEYLRDVRQHGDGSPGTEYDLEFAWWKLSYTAHSEVTDVDRPDRIDWRLIEDLDAVGHWRIEQVDDDPTTTRVTLHVEYRPESANEGAIDLPRLVSLDWVIEKVKPRVEAEAERVVRRVVADLEGERRDVDLDIETN
jgi:uncharacterized membrane protein